MLKKKKVIFVGSFKEKAADGSVGGQMFACRTLLSSTLKDTVDFILIDTTAESVPAPPVYKRIFNAVGRMLTFIFKLFTNKVETAIIFSSNGWSLKEKGLMVLISKLFKAKVIFAPRSGLILNEVATSPFAKRFLKRVIHSADVVICQGASWKDFYIQFEPENPEKFNLLINWIDTEKYKAVYEEHKKRQERSTFKTLKILFLGWLEPNKGILDFLQTFEALLKSGYQLEANVYGAGSLSRELNSKVNSLKISDKFRLLGWADEETKLNALKQADIFVLPSYAEGLPNSLLEAMASGLPCIGSRVGGIPDLISDNVTGLLLDAGNVDQLYQNIVLLYENKEKRNLIGLNAFEFVQANCSVSHTVKYFETIL